MQDIFSNKETFAKVFKKRVTQQFVVDFEEASLRQKYYVLGAMVFETISKNWLETKKRYLQYQPKTVHYFSMEFLMGRLITNNINNLGLRPVIEQGLKTLDIDLNELEHTEVDAGLGNGGLGRLAACFLDSIASLALPGHGNGIRYRYGLFEQGIENGYQIEKPEDWLKDQYVWEVRVEEEALLIPFGGYTSYENGKVIYYPNEQIKAVPYDIPIVGNANGVVNQLRLWNAEPTSAIPEGKNAIEYDVEIRRISGFLYPDDTTYEGKVLRLKQQYFFSAAGVQSILKKHYAVHKTFDNVPDTLVFQINDTHPALVIPEMMRLMIDAYGLEWDKAWDITTKTVAYTNHTLLSEALEKWSSGLMQPVLPRIYQIIEEINKRYCAHLINVFSNNQNKVSELAIIADQQVRMAHLAIVGSFSVNGVAALHTKLLKTVEMKDFDALYKERFNNKTNGITHRRWLKHINPELSKIIDDYSDQWLFNPSELEHLIAKAPTKTLKKQIATMKRNHKVALAKRIEKEQGIVIDPDSIFDVQVKRLHEYKRQLMNALHIMILYNRLKTDMAFKQNYVPHTFIFGAKAASGYHYAKKIIKLINTIADKVNKDPDTSPYLKVVFVENYNVTYAEQIIPACDLSEQISTASKEASGTGNMKFMMNGALTIGTLDGANVEIAELVGEENIIIFGMNSEEVARAYQRQDYQPIEIYHNNREIRLVIDQLTNGFFGHVPKDEFKEIRDKLLSKDEYFVLKDLPDYLHAHEKANALYQDQDRWLDMSIVNIAKSGFFSSDRTISQYASEIWDIQPLKTP